MKTDVIDRNGVKMAGPDSPALAPEGSVVVMAPVGEVSRRQAGILDYLTPAQQASAVDAIAGQKQEPTFDGQRVATGTITAKPNAEMIDRAHAAAPGLDRGTVEDIVYAALGVRKHPVTGA